MEQSTRTWFEWGAKMLLYIFAALLPIWFLPFPVISEFGREATFGILILVATLLWFLGILTRGVVRLQHSFILFAALFMVLAFSASALFSKMPMFSFLYADPISERLFTLIEGILLMVIAGSVMQSSDDVKNSSLLLLSTGLLSGIANIAQIFFNIPVWQKIYPQIAREISFNAVGTQNGLALFYSILLMISLGFLVDKNRGWKQLILSASAFIFFINLILINYPIAWVVVLISSIFLIGINLKDARKNKTFFNRHYAVGALLATVSIVMLLIPVRVNRVAIPQEISPSFRATIEISRSAFNKDAQTILLGTGPGTFGFDWLRFKGRSINQTDFWSVRFNQGNSWLTTLFATTGVLGVLMFMILLATSFVVFLRGILRQEVSGLSIGIFLGIVALITTAILYPVNITFLFSLFLFIGFLSYVMSIKGQREQEETVMLGHEEEEAPVYSSIDTEATGNMPSVSRLAVIERVFRCEGPWAVFFLSLVAIFALVLSVIAIYTKAINVRAALITQKGVEAFNKGNIDGAINAFVQSTQTVEGDPRLYIYLLRIRNEQIKKLIERASRGENIQQVFQSTVALAVQEAQRAISLQPFDSELWHAQGDLYVTLIPFIPGSERFAFNSYKKASELDPLNPAIYISLGQANLIYADRLLAIINQGAPDRDKQVKERGTVLQDAVQAFERAVDTKPDLASAHFLLAQAALRLGNMERAIKGVEGAKLAAPFDIGVAFQLGLLYYQTNDLGRARGEFERAISINDNYSNARYFLGLIYDRQGQKNQAIEQFTRIEQLNPDNQEVKKIITNLRIGKPALQDIVPPLEAPEKRKEAPIRSR